MTSDDRGGEDPATGWLAQSEQLQFIFDSMTGFAIITTDRLGIVTSWNVGAERLLGYPADTMIGRSADIIFPPESGGVVAAEDERRIALAEGRAEDERWQMREDGTRFWASGLMMPLADPDLGFIKVLRDHTAHHLAEARIRESDERQAFLLKLSDALRPIGDPVAVQEVAVAMLAKEIGLDRCGYSEIEDDGLHFVVHREYRAPGVSSHVGRYVIADYGADIGDTLRRGEMVVVNDAAREPAISADALAMWSGADVAAAIGIPLIKGGTLAAVLFGHKSRAHAWQASELQLVREVAERTWASVELARAQAVLRESEARFTQFANASSGGIWIRDAATLTMEYVSPAIASIYGVEREALIGDIEKWGAMIVPDDRAGALAHIERARQGDSMVHEFRIQRQSDMAFRWIRNTDFPLLYGGRVQRIGGIAEDVTEEKLAVEHQAVLLAELQHRVRNIMAVIRSITVRTGRNAADIDEYRELLTGRLLTLARVQALLTRQANAGVTIATILDDELSAQASAPGDYEIQGPDVMLPPKAAETITLAIHELTTNALKYGALSAIGGKVTVHWSIMRQRGTPWLELVWDEAGAPPPADQAAPRRSGFGSELIEGRIPYELGGEASLTIHAGGARCHMRFPLTEGASILETDAPQPSRVFGGRIDMSGAPDLSGQRILVLEDDYYLANDTAWALRGAGASVLGPCANEDAARELIAAQSPTAAVLDINLNGGRSFGLARELGENGVPFLFMTGYDEDIIPPEFEAVERMQKPVDFRAMVEAVARAIGAGDKGRRGLPSARLSPNWLLLSSPAAKGPAQTGCLRPNLC